MEETAVKVSLPPTTLESAEGLMLKEAEVREVLSRLRRGEKIKTIARELGVDRKTIKRWRRVGGWYAQKRKRGRRMDAFSDFVKRRGQRSDGTQSFCAGSCPRSDLPGVIGKSSVTFSRFGPRVVGQSWPRCDMRPGPASRRRWILDSSLCGSGISPSALTCLHLRWAIPGGFSPRLITTNV